MQSVPVPISLEDVQNCANSGVGAIVSSFVPTERHRSACYADEMFEIFIHFGQCLCCLLPVFVKRQPACPHTNSRQVLLHPQMHHRNHWLGKERALVVQTGCKLLVRSPLAKQEGLGQPVRSNLRAPTRTTRFCAPQRPLLLQANFGIVKYTPTKASQQEFLATCIDIDLEKNVKHAQWHKYTRKSRHTPPPPFKQRTKTLEARNECSARNIDHCQSHVCSPNLHPPTPQIDSRRPSDLTAWGCPWTGTRLLQPP